MTLFIINISIFFSGVCFSSVPFDGAFENRLSGVTGKNKIHRGFNGTFEYRTLGNINSGGDTTEASEGLHYLKTDIYMNHRFSKETKVVFSFVAEKPVDDDTLFYEVPELYVKSIPSKKFSVTGGRQILDWSSADKAWRLGLINNKKGFNVVDPGEVGLNVVNLSMGAEPLTVSFIGSYLYVPEKYPSYKIVDGKLYKTSLYGKNFPRTIGFYNPEKRSEIYYRIESTPIDEIIFRKTYGINVKYDFREGGVNFYYLFKPENTYRIRAEHVLDLEKDIVPVDITAKFYNHHVFGGNFRSKILGLDFSTSSITVIPENKPVADNPEGYGVVEEVRNSISFLNVGLRKAFKRVHINLRYLKELLSNYKTEGPLPDAPVWKDAMNFNVEGILSRKWRSFFDFKMSRDTEDRVMACEAKYLFSDSVFLGMGFQLISSVNDKSYWINYNSEDMAYSRLVYYF